MNIYLDLWLVFILTRVYRICATASCSHSFGYRELCPNPMFVSLSGGSVPDSDVSINLRSGYSSRQQQQQNQHSNNIVSCDFFKDKNDVSNIGGIHLSDQPWQYSKASKCTHVVKFQMDPDRGGESSGPPICRKEIGIRTKKRYEEDAYNVFFWHNFTLGSFQATFSDLITNHPYSGCDLSCTHKPKFVQIVILTSRNMKCTLLVQQYRLVDKFRTGCDSIQNPSDHQFCGAYDCSQANNILQAMKLANRAHPLEPHEDIYTEETEGAKDPGGGQEFKGSESLGQVKDDELEEVSSTSSSPPGEAVYKSQKEINWGEWGVRLFFPAFGIAFIFFLLYILKGKYADQMCHRGDMMGSEFHGSAISIEKHALQL